MNIITNNEIPKIDLFIPLDPKRKQDILDRLDQEYNLEVPIEEQKKIITMDDLIKAFQPFMKYSIINFKKPMI